MRSVLLASKGRKALESKCRKTVNKKEAKLGGKYKMACDYLLGEQGWLRVGEHGTCKQCPENEVDVMNGQGHKKTKANKQKLR